MPAARSPGSISASLRPSPCGSRRLRRNDPFRGQAWPARRQRSLRTARHSSGGPRRGRRGPHRLPTRVDHRTRSHLRQYRWHAGAGAGARRLPPQASLDGNGPADRFPMPRRIDGPISIKLRIAQRNVLRAPAPPPTLALQAKVAPGAMIDEPGRVVRRSMRNCPSGNDLFVGRFAAGSGSGPPCTMKFCQEINDLCPLEGRG